MREEVSEDVAVLWRRVRDDLRVSLPDSTFKLWVEPLRAISAEGATLYLTAPDRVRAWAERRYRDGLVAALRRHSPSLTRVAFVDPRSAQGESAPREHKRPELSFENFVIGAGNRFAHAAALAVAEMPGEAYNPLFLHGAPGLGKTHLLQAIAAYIRESHPGLNVRYTTAEAFTSEFVTALRMSGAERFKGRFRDLDALLIDDVQFLENKPQTEEEFFHTFNALFEAGSQVVLSSDRPPQALSRLAERLRNRFEWGLCAKLEAPDLATRLAVLRRLADEAGPDFPPSAVLREIANRAPLDVRRLQGALTRVVAFSSMMDSPATPDLVRDVLAPGSAGPSGEVGAATHSLDSVNEAVCAVLHLSTDDLLSARRTPRIVRARQLAIYVGRARLGLSLNDLARGYKRDRATILHSLRAVERELSPGTDTSEALARVLHHLDGAAQTS